MEELLKKLDTALLKARLSCSTAHPSGDYSYFFGRAQGVCQGMSAAIRIIEDFLSDKDAKDNEL